MESQCNNSLLSSMNPSVARSKIEGLGVGDRWPCGERADLCKSCLRYWTLGAYQESDSASSGKQMKSSQIKTMWAATKVVTMLRERGLKRGTATKGEQPGLAQCSWCGGARELRAERMAMNSSENKGFLFRLQWDILRECRAGKDGERQRGILKGRGVSPTLA